jgi:hypothetical protein
MRQWQKRGRAKNSQRMGNFCLPSRAEEDLEIHREHIKLMASAAVSLTFARYRRAS